MKRSDIGVVLFFYAVGLGFFLAIRQLPDEAKTYPLTILLVLCALNTCFLVRQGLKGVKEGVLNDLPEIFAGFEGRQFLGVLGAAILYILILPLVGFYVASLLFLVGTMLFLRVPKLYLGLTLLVLSALIYLVFTLFLSVPLPVGRLFQ